MPSKADIQIATMTVADLPQVLAIEEASFPLPYSENLFRMELELQIAHVVLAKKDEKVLAYLDFWHVDREMTVISIASHPEARHEGIGSQLMCYLIDYGERHEVEQIFLDVRESNRAAIALYKKFGFEQIDLRTGYYPDNEEDALVMERKL